MTDHLLRKSRTDSERISIHQTQEINYWSKQLNCNPDRLKRGVTAVGPMVKDVRKWLSENKA